MEDRERYGTLISDPSIKIYRKYFKEMVKLLGIRVLYRQVKNSKHWTTYAELEANYEKPILVGCLFDNHPDQQTAKKLGWISELQSDTMLIHVSYDLPVQLGDLFIVPSGLDNTKGRLFRVTKISNQMVYPASITCAIVPEYEDTFKQETSYDYSHKSYTLLNREEDE